VCNLDSVGRLRGALSAGCEEDRDVVGPTGPRRFHRLT
jgi:hypothetical protein